RGGRRDQELRARQHHGPRHEVRDDDHVLLGRAGQRVPDDGRGLRACGLESNREQLQQRPHPDLVRSPGGPGGRRLRGCGRDRQRGRLRSSTAAASATSSAPPAAPAPPAPPPPPTPPPRPPPPPPPAPPAGPSPPTASSASATPPGTATADQEEVPEGHEAGPPEERQVGQVQADQARQEG